jgi:hypothetical protein
VKEVDVNTVLLLLVAIATAINTYFSRKTELNTNSMKDALVKATGEASQAKGRDEMREEFKKENKDA